MKSPPGQQLPQGVLPRGNYPWINTHRRFTSKTFTPLKFWHPDNYYRMVSPRTTTPPDNYSLWNPLITILPGQLPLNNSPLNNYLRTIASYYALSSGQLLKSVSSWVFLSLNFILAKRLLQLGILVEWTLQAPYYRSGHFVHFFIFKTNFFSALLRTHF